MPLTPEELTLNEEGATITVAGFSAIPLATTEKLVLQYGDQRHEIANNQILVPKADLQMAEDLDSNPNTDHLNFEGKLALAKTLGDTTVYSPLESEVRIYKNTAQDEYNSLIGLTAANQSSGAGSDIWQIEGGIFGLYSQNNETQIHTGAGDDVLNITGGLALQAENNAHITIDMAEGNDRLNFMAEETAINSLSGSQVQINMGDGENHIQIQGGNGVIASSGSVAIIGGQDRDEIHIRAGMEAIIGNVSLESGAGDDLVVLQAEEGNGGYSVHTSADETTAIRTGDGNDTIKIQGDVAGVWSNGGTVMLDSGAGNDRVVIAQTDELALQNNSAGHVNILTDSGNDTIEIASMVTDSEATTVVDSGADDDTVTIGSVGAYEGGTITLNGGAGNDTVNIGSVGAMGGTMTLDGGDGNDTLVLDSGAYGLFVNHHNDVSVPTTINNFETIDLRDPGSVTLFVMPTSGQGEVKILGEASDQIHFWDDWARTGEQQDGGHTYNVYQYSGTTLWIENTIIDIYEIN